MLLTLLILGVLLRKQAEHPVFWVVAWPGTLVHELSHYLVGLVLLARPNNISLLPSNGGTVHGYVEFDNLAWYNALPTALAPLLGFVAALAIVPHLTWSMAWSNLGLWWVAVCLVSQSWPSHTDWNAAFSSWPGVAFYATIAGYFLL